MKKVLLMLCACAALICSCSKVGDNISDLNKRVEEYEAEAVTLLTKLEALQKIADAKAKQLTIVSIKDTEAGQEIAFSDGKKYVIKDGEDTIIVTEDETSYTFDFGNGKKISVDKTFEITLDKDVIDTPAGEKVVLKYAVTADDGTVNVVAKSLGKSKILAIDEEAKEITIRAAGRDGEEQMIDIRAIRNSDGKISEKIATINCGPHAPIALEGAISGYYPDEGDDTDCYYTQFWKGEVDEENYFVGDAVSILYELWTPMAEAMSVIPVGSFVADDTYAPFTYTIGEDYYLKSYLEEDWEEWGWLYKYYYDIYSFEEYVESMGYDINDLDKYFYKSGAELYLQYEDETYDDYAIKGGEVKVEVSDADNAKFTLNILANNEDWVFTYEGAVEYEDHTPVPVSNYFDDCVATDLGDIYGNGTKVWDLECTKSGTTEIVYLAIITDGNAGAPVYGTYTASDSHEAFTIIPGSDYSYWWKYSMVWDTVDSGTLTISNPTEDLNGWIMKGNFYDDRWKEDWTFDFKGALGVSLSDDNWMAPRTEEGRFGRDITRKPTREDLINLRNGIKAKETGKEVKVPFYKHR